VKAELVPIEEASRIKDNWLVQLETSMESTRRSLEHVTNVLNLNPLPDNFEHLDAVTKDDSSTNGTVSIIGSATPRLVTVSNVGRAYSFAGGSMDGDVTSFSMTYR
jgi:hypothetical protein